MPHLASFMDWPVPAGSCALAATEECLSVAAIATLCGIVLCASPSCLWSSMRSKHCTCMIKVIKVLSKASVWTRLLFTLHACLARQIKKSRQDRKGCLPYMRSSSVHLLQQRFRQDALTHLYRSTQRCNLILLCRTFTHHASDASLQLSDGSPACASLLLCSSILTSFTCHPFQSRSSAAAV